MKKRPDIQGLRAIAVLSVIAYHAGLPIPGGFVGVDIFFVISGYVITLMISRELVETKQFNFFRFYIRRFKRLVPALVIVVIVTLLASVLFLSPFGAQQNVAYTGLGAIFLSANAAIALTTGGYFDAAADYNPLLHMWSLSVEEQFYVVFPALFAFAIIWANRRVTRIRVDVILLILLTSFSFVIAILASTQDLGPRAEIIFGFYSPVSRVWEFGFGALVALAAQRLLVLAQNRWLAGASSTLGLAFLVAGFVLINAGTPWPGVWTVFPVVGTALLLISGLNEANIVTRLFGTKPFVAVGDWSYSLYLWHWPFIVVALAIWPGNALAGVIAAIVSLIPAVVVFYKVENPFRFAPLPTAKRAVLSVSALILIPAIIATCVLVGANNTWGMKWGGLPANSDHAAFANCVDKTFNAELCTWKSKENVGTVLLVGDSQAWSYADGAIPAAMDLGLNITVSTVAGCPFASSGTSGGHAIDCRKWQKRLLDYADQTQPVLVLIANRSSGYASPDPGGRVMLDTTGAAATLENSPILYSESLQGVVKNLMDSNIPVLILQNIPKPLNDAGMPFRTETIYAKFFASKVTDQFALNEAKAFASPGRQAETRVRDMTGAHLFDPFDALCDRSSCRLFTDNEPIYQDFNHLSVKGSLSLRSALSVSISNAIRR